MGDRAANRLPGITRLALYEAPFTGLHAGGPDGLFAGKSEMITVLFQAIEATQPVGRPEYRKL